MSFVEIYMSITADKKHRDRIHLQEAIRNDYAKQREEARATEARLKAKQKEDCETFHANLLVRKLDLNNMATLYPIANTVSAFFSHHHRSLESLYTMRALNSSPLLFDVNQSTSHYLRFSEYVKLGSMCNDANHALQVTTTLASNLFFEVIKQDKERGLSSPNIYKCHQVNSHLIMGLAATLFLLAERSSHPYFSLFWSFDQDTQSYLRSLKNIEGQLIRTFCPDDIAQTNDFNRMRELYWVVKYWGGMGRTVQSDNPILGNSNATSLDLLQSSFTDEHIKQITDGMKALYKRMNNDVLSQYEELCVGRLAETYPVFYVVTSVWSIFESMSPAIYLSMITNLDAFWNPDKAMLNASETTIQLRQKDIEGIFDFDKYFPEVKVFTPGDSKHLLGMEVWEALSSANISLSQGSKDTPNSHQDVVNKGTIEPNNQHFTVMTSLIADKEDRMSLKGGLGSHFTKKHNLAKPSVIVTHDELDYELLNDLANGGE